MTGTEPRDDPRAGAAAPGADPSATTQEPRFAPAPGPPAAAAIRPEDPRGKSPALACILSAMPGLGQVYVGYYQRGFTHALVVATIIAILAGSPPSELQPLLGMFLAFFWLYNIIDAGRRASLFNYALAGQETIELPGDFRMPRGGGSIAGGVLLIVAGFVLLLHTRWDMSLAWIEDWWPLAPIGLGVYLLAREVQARREAGS